MLTFCLISFHTSEITQQNQPSCRHDDSIVPLEKRVRCLTAGCRRRRDAWGRGRPSPPLHLSVAPQWPAAAGLQGPSAGTGFHLEPRTSAPSTSRSDTRWGSLGDGGGMRKWWKDGDTWSLHMTGVRLHSSQPFSLCIHFAVSIHELVKSYKEYFPALYNKYIWWLWPWECAYCQIKWCIKILNSTHHHSINTIQNSTFGNSKLSWNSKKTCLLLLLCGFNNLFCLYDINLACSLLIVLFFSQSASVWGLSW